MPGKLKKVIGFWIVLSYLLLAGCKPEGIIPVDAMATVLSEFYLADATIDAVDGGTGTQVRGLDSLQVYLPILEKYGYDKEIFRESLSYYLHRPDELQSIFKRTRAQLDDRVAQLEREEGLSSGPAGEDREDHGDEEMAAREELVEEALDGISAPEKPAREKKAPTRRNVKKKLSKKELRELERELE